MHMQLRKGSLVDLVHFSGFTLIELSGSNSHLFCVSQMIHDRHVCKSSFFRTLWNFSKYEHFFIFLHSKPKVLATFYTNTKTGFNALKSYTNPKRWMNIFSWYSCFRDLFCIFDNKHFFIITNAYEYWEKCCAWKICTYNPLFLRAFKLINHYGTMVFFTW